MDSPNILILAGGHSSRMGSPKHLLSLAGRPLYHQLTRSLGEALPEITTVHISIANRSVLDQPMSHGLISIDNPHSDNHRDIELVAIIDDTENDMGPAAGLLAAWRYDPTATWLVVACDFPLLSAAAVRQLIDSYATPVTCFKNGEGFSEPLLAIWSPLALHTLDDNVKNGRSGPSFTVKKLDGKLIEPTQQEWLVNVNTKDEWEVVKSRLEQD